MRRTFLFHQRMPTRNLSLVILILGALLLSLICLASLSQAQAPITSSGLNTQVSEPMAIGGQTQYDITGGTRPNGGLNLFHSFGDFGVPTKNIANFLNETGLPTSNILGRVTGGNMSTVLGAIQTTGFGTANLFLMNPAGFLFGPNATVNVGGMVAFTSADYLRLTDNARFNASPNSAADALLSALPVAAFGFLGSNPGAITVRGSQFTVTEGNEISLVGGNITIESGTLDNGVVQPAVLSAPAGQITFASAASPGEFLAGTLEQAPNSNSQSFGALGEIQISQKSLLDVSGDGGGSVLIRSGRFVVDDSMIFANVTGPGPVTNGVESIGSGIDILVSQDAVIQNGALLETNVVGNATAGVQYGGVSIKADRIEILGSQDFENFPLTGMFSHVAQDSTEGNGGDINLEGNSILVRDFGTVTTFVETLTDGAGNAGDITLKTNGNLELDGLVFVESLAGASGNAGNIELTSTQGNVLMTNSPFVTSTSGGSGTVGDITVNAPNGDILMTGSPDFGPAVLFTHIDGTGANAGKGGIELTAQNLSIENSGIQIDNFTPFQSGSLTINLTGRLTMSGGDIFPSTLLTTTRRSALSADLNITAHDILLTDGSLVATETFRSGEAGTLNIFTENLQITNGAQIRSSSRFNPFPPPDDPLDTPSGAGGTITIQGLASPAQSILIDGADSGIFTDTEGTGAGGNIFVNADSVTLQNGGTLSAKTSGTDATATGGSITVKATDQVTMTSGASVSASSTGPGNAGNIHIDAGQTFVATNSHDAVTTQANVASGGNIAVLATEMIQLTNSRINASVEGSKTTVGGNIMVDPQVVILQNSQILAQATQGNGGDISITTNLLLQDANSRISASSQFGVNGTVTIQSPNSPASGKIQPLGNELLETTALLNQRCAALAGGEFSSFTVAGRDSLPTEPGSWLASPLVAFVTGEALGVRGEGVPLGASLVSERTLLSLRQVAPTGFLTQAFAQDWSAGCQS